MKRYLADLLITLAALVGGGCLGWGHTHSWSGAATAIVAVFTLGLIEVSLSLDNAVVNAAILKRMSPLWQKRFLTWGMLIAVLGMRFLFPILIVAFVADISPWRAVDLALWHAPDYAAIMQANKFNISAFGGSFLLLLALTYFLDEEKTAHWFGPLEERFAGWGGINGLAFGLALGALLVCSQGLGTAMQQRAFLLWGGTGIVAYVLIKEVLGWLIDSPQAQPALAQPTLMQAGLMSFLYLEFIDSSFSFDGVMTAFAITTDPILILLGLGIGALFVRTLTLGLVRQGALEALPYLEQGAFYTIALMALLMLGSVFVDVPDWVTALLSLGLIGAAFLASLYARAKG